MTLVVQLATRDFIVQVTDRLVTQGIRPFDDLANKNIIFGASNAIAAIAYTGGAYIESITTDQWIAEKLSGVTYDRKEGPAAFTLRNKIKKPWRDLGMSLMQLRTELQKYTSSLKGVQQKQWEAKNFVICISAFQWKKKGNWRPVIALVHKPPGNKCYFWQEDRDWYLKSYHQISWVPRQNLTADMKKDLQDRIYGCRVARQVDKAIADGIREVSKRNPVIGPNCMGIFIDSPSRAQVWVRYLPAQPTRETIPYGSEQKEVDIVYSPWVVGPQNIMAPTVIGGAGWIISVGHYTVTVKGNEKEGEMPEGLHVRGQKRKPYR